MWINVVGDNAKADPALHTFEPSISAAIQSVALLQGHANAAVALGQRALSGPEPTGFLQFSPLAAFAVAIRHRDSRQSDSLEFLLSHLCECHQEGAGSGFSCDRGQPLLILWDRLPGHRSRLVQEYIAGLQGWQDSRRLQGASPYAYRCRRSRRGV